MSWSSKMSRSNGFAATVAMLVSLGAQVLLESLPWSALGWLLGDVRSGPVVLVAGATSFWREEALIRALAFGIGAMVACLIVRARSWALVAGLVAMAVLCTASRNFRGRPTACRWPSGQLRRRWLRWGSARRPGCWVAEPEFEAAADRAPRAARHRPQAARLMTPHDAS